MSLNPLHVCAKVYKYFMNGRHMGHLYLHRDKRVQWHTQATNIKTDWHGEWYTTHNGRALKVHFDYAGVKHATPNGLGYPKWTWLKDFDGIDYEGRWITIEFLSSYTSHDGGATFEEIPMPIEDISLPQDAWEILPANPRLGELTFV